MRTIAFNTNAVDLHQIAETTGYSPLYAAIAYLVCWNMGFDKLTLTVLPDQLEMTAVYEYSNGAPGRYVIGAVWHEDHFGFHS